MDIFKHHHAHANGTLEPDPAHQPTSVPEIDPGGAIGAITFLVFAIACWAGRSGRK